MNQHSLTSATETQAIEGFRADVLEGLSQRPKRLSSKYFYDEEGSRIFDQICELDEYYVTRTEMQIMERHVEEMADAIGSNSMIIEPGSGSSLKTRLLLEHAAPGTSYVPIDISREHLFRCAEQIAFEFPQINVTPLHADFCQSIDLPPEADNGQRRVVYFPGSTIGNFEVPLAQRILEQIAHLVQPDGGLLIGFDLRKDVNVLERAYDDRRGVTAAFNLNLLHRINNELGGTFDIDSFRHRAIFNDEASRIEMHLVSEREQTARVGDHQFHFEQGESICTEYSHKYSIEGFSEMLERVGFQEQQIWIDPRKYFAIGYYNL